MRGLLKNWLKKKSSITKTVDSNLQNAVIVLWDESDLSFVYNVLSHVYTKNAGTASVVLLGRKSDHSSLQRIAKHMAISAAMCGVPFFVHIKYISTYPINQASAIQQSGFDQAVVFMKEKVL